MSMFKLAKSRVSETLGTKDPAGNALVVAAQISVGQTLSLMSVLIL